MNDNENDNGDNGISEEYIDRNENHKCDCDVCIARRKKAAKLRSIKMQKVKQPFLTTGNYNNPLTLKNLERRKKK